MDKCCKKSLEIDIKVAFENTKIKGYLEDEITVITAKENLKELNALEIVGDYKLIEFKPAVPFQTVGFLAKIAETIANEGMNILIVSTFSKDYIMIKEELCEKGISALKNIGFPIEYEI